MGKVFAELNDNLVGFIGRQPVFFVASAPSGDGGHMNVSPKGLAGSLSVIGRTSWRRTATASTGYQGFRCP